MWQVRVRHIVRCARSVRTCGYVASRCTQLSHWVTRVCSLLACSILGFSTAFFGVLPDHHTRCQTWFRRSSSMPTRWRIVSHRERGTDTVHTSWKWHFSIFGKFYTFACNSAPNVNSAVCEYPACSPWPGESIHMLHVKVEVKRHIDIGVCSKIFLIDQ